MDIKEFEQIMIENLKQLIKSKILKGESYGISI